MKNWKPEDKIWTVPNILTFLRLALIPVYWVLMMHLQQDLWALAAFAAATLTDLADGYLARKLNQITSLGKLLDPLADKLMVISVMVTLLLRGILPPVMLILLAAKELVMVAGSAAMLNRQIVVHSLFIGKAAQFVICVGLALCFVTSWFAAWTIPLHLAVLWLGIALAYGALAVYARTAIRQLQGKVDVYSHRERGA